MAKASMQQTVEKIFARADVQINGDRPWDIQVHNERFYTQSLGGGSLGFGESYMDGDWDCAQLDECIARLIRVEIHSQIRTPAALWQSLNARIINMQNKKRSMKVIEKHYNLDSNLYMSFLDPYNQYTCGYFKGTDDLDTAQEQKLELICRKLQLNKDDHVLDIGCGWGGFAKYAAEHYGCHVTGISISDEQIAFAKKYCDGLPVEILRKDYRDVEGTFDKVLVCGMIEHVGYKNYRTLMRVIDRVLEDKGIFLLHTIGRNTSTISYDPWMGKYIFPNSMLPSLKQLLTASEGIFLLEDLHNFGAYYEQTLLAWYENFVKNWEKIKFRYDERFFRMFSYYLLSSAGAFRIRSLQLWQCVFTKNGIAGGYLRPTL